MGWSSITVPEGIMRKFIVVLAIVVVVLVAAVIILLVNLERLVDSQKDTILARASTALGRSVTVDEIGVGLLGGVGVELGHVSISDDSTFSQEPFVTANKVVVRVKFLPLLRKELQVKRLVLDEPVIRVIRDADGRFNFASLGPAPATGESESADSVPAANPAKLPLVLAFADIENGTVEFEDRRGGTHMTVDQIDLAVRNAAMGETASIELAAAIVSERPDIALEGTVGPIPEFKVPGDLASAPVQLKVTVGPVAFENVRKILPPRPSSARLEVLDIGDVEGTLEITGTLGALQVSDAELSASVLGAADKNLTLRAHAGPFDVLHAEGGIPSDLPVAGEVSISPLPLGRLTALFPAAPKAPAKPGAPPRPDLTLEGEGAVEAKFDGNLSALSANLQADFSQGSVAFGDKFRKPSGVPLRATATLAASKEAIVVQKGEITFSNLVLAVDGRVDLAAKGPRLDIRARCPETDLSGWGELVPMLKTYDAGGVLSLDARIVGALAPKSRPAVDGTLSLQKGRARVPQIPEPVTEAAVTLSISGGRASVAGASARIGRSVVRIDGDASSLKPLSGTFVLKCKEAYRSDFQTLPAPAPRPEVFRDIVVEGTLWQEQQGIRERGVLTSSGGTVTNVDYKNLRAEFEGDPEEFRITRFAAQSLGGTIEGKGTYQPKRVPPSFDLSAQVKSVDVMQYFTYKVPALTQFMSGRIDLNLAMQGGGKTWDEIKPTLAGDGSGVVLEGALMGVNIAEELLSGLSEVPFVEAAALDRIRQRNPKLFSGSNTAFQDLKGEISISDGKLHSKGLVLRTDDYSLRGDGWISFDKSIELATSIVFSNQVTQDIVRELQVAKYLTNEQGRLEIPLTLTGPLTRPKVAPDLEVIGNKLRSGALGSSVDQLKGQVKGGLKDVFSGFGKKPAEKPVEKPPEKPDTTANPR